MTVPDCGGDCGSRAVNRASRKAPVSYSIVVVECASLVGDREDEEKDKEQKKIGKQTERRAREAAVRGSAGDKAGPGCRTPHLGRGSDTLFVCWSAVLAV